MKPACRSRVWKLIGPHDSMSLEAVTWSSLFLHYCIGLSHHWRLLFQLIVVCGYSFLQRSHHSVSIRLSSRFPLGSCNTFSFQHYAVDLLVSYCPDAWTHFSEAMAVSFRPIPAALTLDYFDIQRSSWLTQWLRGPLGFWLQDEPDFSPVHHRLWQLVWGVCADVLCLAFVKWEAVHYSQISPLMPKGHHSIIFY